MQQLSLAPPHLSRLRYLDCLGEEGPSPYPTDRWLASALLQLQWEGAAEVLEMLTPALAGARPGQPGRLGPDVLQRLWDHYRVHGPRGYVSGELEKFSLGLEPAECLLLSSLLPELRALELRHQAHTRLSGKVAAVVRDTLEVLRQFLGPEAQLPEGFEEAFQEVLQGWSSRLWMSEEEGRHALCVLWATQMAGRFQAPQQEWRYCLACLEQTLYRHVGPGAGRLLQSYWNGLAAATGLFELCGLVCKQAPTLRAAWGSQSPCFEAEELLAVVLGEVLLDCDPLQESWPSLVALSAAAAPLGGVSPEDFAAFRRSLLNGLRGHMERNWLDLLAAPLDRMQAALQLRAWKRDQRTALQQACSRACSSLREVLGAFNANPKAEQDLRALLEAAWESASCGRSSLLAQQLFRRWLGPVFLPFVAPRWQQPKAVVAALKTALQALPEGGSLAPILPLLEGLPTAWSEVCDGLKAGHSWLANCGLERRAWQLWLAEGGQAARRLSRQCLRDWSFEDESAVRPDLQQLRLRCPLASSRQSWEAMQEKLELHWLSHLLWSQAETIARQASAFTFRKMSDYARQAGTARGLEKCARDNAFTLRRVALAWELEVEDPVSFLSDWWNGMVNAYLTGRPSRLFHTNLQGLLRAAGEVLEPAQLEQLEAVLRPVYEEAAGQEEEPSVLDFQPVNWQLPLTQKLEFPIALELSEEQVQTALRLSRAPSKPVGPWKGLLQDGWRRYLWHGCLDPQWASRWLDYLEENVAQPRHLEAFLQGLVWAQEPRSPEQALPLLGYLQALLDFTHQSQAARQEGESALLRATLPSPFCSWEERRRCLEQAGRGELPDELAPPADLQRAAALYAGSSEPLFSPNVEEEIQWRQLLGLLLVAAWVDCPQEESTVCWALAGSLSVVRSRDFEKRLSRLQQLLAERCPDLPPQRYGPTFEQLLQLASRTRQLEQDARSWDPNTDLLEVAAQLPSNWSSGPWPMPCSLRLRWALKGQAGGTLAALWAADFELPQAPQERQRELRWAARSLAWQHWLLQHQPAPPSLAPAALDQEGLTIVARYFAGQDGSAGVGVSLRALEANTGLLWLGLDAPRPRCQPWLMGPALHKAGADSDLTPEEQAGLAGFGRLLADHCLEVVRLEQLSAAAQLRLQSFCGAGFERVCDGLLAALPGSGLDTLEQLALTVGLQSLQQAQRHLRLGLKLSQLLEEPGWPASCRELLQLQALLWQRCTPELSWLNLLARVQQQPALLPPDEEWQAVGADILGQLDLSERRIWKPWLRHLRNLGQELPRSLPLAQAWHDLDGPLYHPRPAPPATVRLVRALLALDLAREAQLPGQNAMTRTLLSELTSAALEEVEQRMGWLRSQRIDLDFAPLQRQLSHLSRWLERPQQAREQLLEQFPGLFGERPEELLDILADPLPVLQGPWAAPRALLLTPKPLLQRLAALPEEQLERLHTALGNALGPELESGRWLDMGRRLPELEAVWQRSEALELGSQAAHPFWRSLLRRVAVEGWLEGRPYSGQGVVAWIGFNLAAGEAQSSARKPFLKAAREVLQWAKTRGNFSPGMARLAEETLRCLERRLEVPDLTLWESLDQPTLDASTAQKPFKRSLWGRISSSLEGLVRGR